MSDMHAPGTKPGCCAPEAWVPLEEFPAQPGETWDQLRARWRAAMKGRAPGVAPRVKIRIPHTGRYAAELARFPNDPQAYVGGEISEQKLHDQRLREGWVEVQNRHLDGKPAHMRDAPSAAEVAMKKVLNGEAE